MRKHLSLVIGLVLIGGMFAGCSHVGPGDGYYGPPRMRKDIGWSTKNQLGLTRPDNSRFDARQAPVIADWGRKFDKAVHTSSALFLGYDVNDPMRGYTMPQQANFVGRNFLNYNIRDPYRGDPIPRFP